MSTAQTTKQVIDDFDTELIKALLAYPHGVFLPVLLNSKFSKLIRESSYDTARKRLFRRLERLRRLGLVLGEKVDGMLFYKLTPHAVNLIRQATRKTQTDTSDVNLLGKAEVERILGFLSILRAKAAEELDKPHDEVRLEKVRVLFSEYLEEAKAKRVILKIKPEYEGEDDTFLILPYRTRFTSRVRAREIYKKYEACWKAAGELFRFGVFLTLTCDPKKFKSRKHAARELPKKWNAFLAWAKKRIMKAGKRRIAFLKVLEFTDNGFPHLHIVIFGIRRLADFREISKEWERLGYGKIVYIYALQKKRGGKWTWLRKKPKDARSGVTPIDYLRKYISKVVEECGKYNPREKAKLELYWALNKRFFSYSYKIFRETKIFKKLRRITISISIYEFFMSLREDEIPDFIWEQAHPILVWQDGKPVKPPPPKVRRLWRTPKLGVYL